MPSQTNKSISLQTRLSLAFAALCALMLISLVVTIFKSKQVDDAVNEIVGESVPVAFAGGQLASDVNASMAALRGWVLTADQGFVEQRAQVWVRINNGIASLESFNTSGEATYQDLKDQLARFQDAQNRVETIAHSADDLPATKLLNEQVTPLTDGMLSTISQAYIEEIGLAATPVRKQMLGQMGDIRGAIAVVSGNIRAYLLTGQNNYLEQYRAVWNWALGRMDELRANSALMSETQLANFTEFSASAEKVSVLFEELIRIRSSDEWNRSRALLVSEVIPLAGSILELLTNAENGIVAQKRNDVEVAGDKAVWATVELTSTAYFLAFAGVVLGVLMVMLSTKNIIKPVRKMTEAMTRLAHGEQEVSVPGTERGDEIGDMAQALQVFKENSEERQRLEIAQSKDRERREARAKRIEELSLSFEGTIRKVLDETSHATNRMFSSAQSMQETAQSTLEQTKSVASATQQTQQNVELVAGATGQLSKSFDEVSENAKHSVAHIGEAITKGENASRTVNWMSEASSRIGEVVQMIEDIASQTNLLALNATVEAARAGEAGKGFAVVAGEVKNLANQTSRATQEIAENIKRMQETTDKSVSAIQEVCDTISDVGDQAAGVRDTVVEQNAATQDISGNVEDVAQNTGIISENILEVESAATQTNEAAGQMLEAVNDVSKQADDLKNEVETFLNALKTA